ncbi:hypothetical protein [Amycolatopsis suaedae]|uniref:Uncharacterized protein n=1 Tax=Amycolatopsis suaedae TaxID=2510978 RepID=A0A4Q7J7Z6_9PSEU|nr:hypothetical protein [Amycolatopsis suaedae]RZQ63016.1 hypothetical protein EWH70_15095 [Amycolatopsis suaedae]
MLAGVAETLTRDGWLVVLPSRRYSPLADEQNDGAGRAIWVEAQWERPRELAAKAEQALGGPADLLVAWVHDSYRRSVMEVVEPLLAPDAPVVEVRDANTTPATDPPPDPLLARRPTQQVLLGTVSEVDEHRSLGHAEIAEGMLTAVHRAVEGKPSSIHQIGQRRPVLTR